MAMTLENVTAFVRSMLGESTARYWTDAEITLYLQMSKTKVQAQFFPFLWNQYKLAADFATTVNVSLYNYPTDAFKVVDFHVKETGHKLSKVEEDRFYKYADMDAGDPVAWTFHGGQVKLFPTPSTSDTDYLYCWYMKNLTITSTTVAVTDFPDSCKMLIGIESVILGRAKDNAVTGDLIELRKLYESVIMTELNTSLSDGPYA